MTVTPHSPSTRLRRIVVEDHDDGVEITEYPVTAKRDDGKSGTVNGRTELINFRPKP